ncbi:predicted protein [Chaetomium globosum CBS 148.51]|uniref:Uncharacterized protein n=1 Tax=Chaetomium globosum (strain ATCC 6205 / CBS 148.51 / DSM 1962 / NBRC 6347 / NRRL 1970) TaxID=306901 RepID=Q2H338_CHAGB|nr:uncharacterized protein CHGG_03808 [Chaetomium globosum CBS 148.51]EAQ87189.1 predicted protein [Chaetomium globosum CBS 148.51]
MLVDQQPMASQAAHLVTVISAVLLCTQEAFLVTTDDSSAATGHAEKQVEINIYADSRRQEPQEITQAAALEKYP